MHSLCSAPLLSCTAPGGLSATSSAPGSTRALTEWIQNQAHVHPSGPHAGISAGTANSVLRYHTHVWFTLKMVKSSGCTSLPLPLYAIASAQPITSSMPVVWNWDDCWPGHGQFEP